MHPAKVTRRKVSAVPPFTPTRLQYMTREPQADFSRAGHRYAALVVRRKHTVHHVILSTRFSELTPCARHPRRMLAIPTGGGHRRELRSIEKARTSRNRFQRTSRFAPAFCDFSRNFVDFLMFFLAPSQANLGASITISRFREKKWTKIDFSQPSGAPTPSNLR